MFTNLWITVPASIRTPYRIESGCFTEFIRIRDLVGMTIHQWQQVATTMRVESQFQTIATSQNNSAT